MFELGGEKQGKKLLARSYNIDNLGCMIYWYHSDNVRYLFLNTSMEYLHVTLIFDAIFVSPSPFF